MSGLCVIVHLDGSPVDPSLPARMAEAAIHRGPDGIRTWRDGPAALVHLATHVTPEDARERQPLVHGHLVLVADARLDNRDELVPLLRAKRLIPDAEATDTELILAAHRHWGHEAPAQLIGDFAYVLYDTESRELFAARDAFGMRAVHYHASDRLLLLATDIEQLLAHPGVPVALFEPMVAAHLAGPYGRDGWTFYAGIHQLPPAHALLATPQGVRTWRYWAIDPEEHIRYRREDDYAEHLRELLSRSVAARSRSAKPIGIMLSGGLDSGAIASTLGRLPKRRSEPVTHTYSWAFASPGLADGDERRVSDQIVEQFGFSPRAVASDQLWPLKNYPSHGPDRDAPYILVYQAMFDHAYAMAASDGVGPIWHGDRGDEMFGDWVFDHPGLLLTGQWRTLVRELRAHATWSSRPLRSVVRQHLLSPLRSDVLRTEQDRRPEGWSRHAIPPYVQVEWAHSAMLGETVRIRTAPATRMSATRHQRFERVFFFRGLRDPAMYARKAAQKGLTYVDPFADRSIASFALGVPTWVLQRPSEPKRLLRRAMRGVMPDAVLQSVRKAEPGGLFDLGFRDRSRATVRDLLTDMQLERRGFVDAAILREAYETYVETGRVRRDFWWPLTLEMWLRRYWA